MTPANRSIGTRIAAFIVLAATTFAFTPTADAGVSVRISRANQTMHVYVNKSLYYSWRVSTGRKGYTTPRGSYRPTRLVRMHYSSKYNNSPMPHSVFFHRGYAIHGTNYIRNLGRRASHGCIRLHPGNARTLYGLVRKYGRSGTRIIIR